MKKNGFTVVELIVSFVLIATISLFLFQLIFILKDLYVSSGIKTKLLTDQAIINEKINKEFRHKTITLAYKCGLNCLSFNFSDGSSTSLSFDRDKGTLSYGDYNTKLLDGSQFGNINITTDTVLNVASGKNDSIVRISIPIYHKLIKQQDFGINIIYQYDSRNAALSGLFISDVLDVDKRVFLTGSTEMIAFKDIPFVDPGYFIITGEGTITQNDPSVIVTGNVGNEIGETYTLTYTIFDSLSNIMDQKTRNVTIIDSVSTFGYSGDAQIFNAPVNGLYQIEVWGAQGGSRGAYNIGGMGGYTVGQVNLAKNNVLNIFVGGSGSYNGTEVANGGFNGGGNSGKGSSSAGASGGGATDIRMNGTGLANRIIVAGGGGGSGSKNDSAEPGHGGPGGGLSGLTGTSTASYNGSGGTDSIGGAKATYNTSITVTPSNGAFGIGGIGGSYADTFGGGGGGGGYYGGGGGVRYGTGGGGSGYCGSMLNCTTYAGNTSFTSPTGSNETGHSGDGYVKITLISITS